MSEESTSSMDLDPPIQEESEETCSRNSKKRKCRSEVVCEFAEEAEVRKRRRTASSTVCAPSQTLEAKHKLLQHRVDVLENENCALKDDIDRLNGIIAMRYHKIHYLENVCHKLCKLTGLEFNNEDFGDPELYCSFRSFPVEVMQRIAQYAGIEGRLVLKQTCLMWRRLCKSVINHLTVHCAKGMRALRDYPSLKCLKIVGSCVVDRDYNDGKYLLQLRTLILEDIKTVPFNCLGELPHLTELSLKSNSMCNMAGLEYMVNLERLSLACILSPFTFPTSACHLKLKQLSIQDCICIKFQPRYLQASKDLERFYLDTPLHTPLEDLDWANSFPKLSQFAIIAYPGESTLSLSLTPLKNAIKLTTLNLRGYANINYRPMASARLPNLTSFIPGLSNDEELVPFLDGCGSTLLRIELRENEEITNDTVANIAKYCTQLTQIIIIDCLGITEDAIWSIKAMPKLTCMQLSPKRWWSNFGNLDRWRTACKNVQLDDF